MRILVTGAAGFVGRAVVARLAGEGHSLVALDTHDGGQGAAGRVRTVAGDLADPAVRRAALADGCDALIHLATVPGGAAEADPALSRRINVDAMYDVLEDVRAAARRPARVVYASSIAVLGDALPAAGVDDGTPLAPRLIYAGHKAMMENVVTMMSHRGEIDGVSIRLPGILARPRGPSGMKSAFMSDLFHAALSRERFTCPVSPDATIWAQSIAGITANIAHALDLDSAALPPGRAVTLPALRVAMRDLIGEAAAQTGAPLDLVDYRPDAALEQAFGAYPPLATPAATRAGFAADRDVAALVAQALHGIRAQG